MREYVGRLLSFRFFIVFSKSTGSLVFGGTALLLFLFPFHSNAQIDADFFNGGGIRVGDSATACPGNGGSIRFDADSSDGGGLQYCDGASWLGILTDTVTGDVSQGGNSFAAPMIIGTNDSNTLAFETNGSTRMTIDTSGNVGIGATTPSAKLEVVGQIVSQTNNIASGATVDFNNGNTQTLASVGGTSITLSNMVDGGSYVLIIIDTTSRTYTFSGCTNSYFKPSNGPTDASSRSLYSIMAIDNGGNFDCYITWATGYF